jgi:hypothetical protein
MQYMLLIYSDEKAAAAMPKADLNKMLPAYEAYTKALQSAGALVAGDRLKTTDSASTIRVRDGKSQVLDGPYAETKEQLGGFYIVEAEDLDAAIDWAARCPGASHGAVEVRPLWRMTT